MTKRTKTSIEAKLFILTFGIIFTVLLTVGHLAMSQYRTAIMEQKRQEFDSITRTLGLSASHIVGRKDQHLLKTVSSRVRASRMGLEYVVIADRDGHTLFAESRNLPKASQTAGMRWWMVVRKIMGYGNITPSNIYSVTVPVFVANNQPGTLSTGFNLTKAKQEVDAVQSKVILALSLGLIIGIIYATLLGKTVSTALRSLVKCAREVSTGNLAVRMEGSASREVDELSQAFNYMVETLSENQEKLMERVNTDSLTGLYNHRYFQERLTDEVARASRYEHQISLLMIDIDFFKIFNDTQGHPAGDEALRSLAEILRASTRTIDIIARYGGEEFSVVLPETGAEEAMTIAERIRHTVEDSGLAEADCEVRLTVSIGLASYPAQCLDKQALMAAADTALYQAKARGRNVVSVYDSLMQVPETDPYKLCVLLHAQDMATVEALAEAVDAKLKFPTGHSKSVATLASTIALKLGMPESECEAVYMAGLLRDVGQIAVPEEILCKPEALTDQEVTIIRTHSTLGHSIVQKAPRISSMLPAILHHHERYDGTGYPSGIAGNNIPLPARILAVADAYQSMITLRPHRRMLSPAEAVTELIDNSSSQFDPGVVQAALEILAGHYTPRLAA